MIDPAPGLEQLRVFIKSAKFYSDPQAYGTQGYTRLTMNKNVVFTDGVVDMCKRLECYWLADAVASHVGNRTAQEFVAVYFIKDGNAGHLFGIDDENIIFYQKVPFTDIEESVKLFVGHDQEYMIVMLPSEY